MKVWQVALNTYRGLLRSRALLVFLFIVLFTFLGSAGTVFFATQLASAGAAEQSRLLFARQIESLLSTYAVFAFILAVLAGAYVLPGELKTGTIVPTLGRAVSRGQYLLGLFLGLNLLLASYAALAGLSIGGLLLWGGVSPGPAVPLGVLYALLTANIVMAMAFFYSTRLGPLVAITATVLTLSLPGLTEAVRLLSQPWSERLEKVSAYLLPAWDLIDYGDYFVLTRSPAARGLDVHLVGILHALDYLAVLLLLAFFLFRRRSLLPPV